MKISWLGHSCFKIEDDSGKVVVTDPFDESVGYPLPRIRADVVVVSHDHHDHNNVKVLEGDPKVIRGSGKQTAAGIEFEGIATYHDEKGGKLRGKNTIFCFEIDGVRVCHLGDLGHQLGEKETAALGPVDVLMIPVGGTFTLDAGGAKKVLGQIRPRIAIPMHFKTAAVHLQGRIRRPVPLGPEGREAGTYLEVSKETLPKGGEGPLIVLLDYK